MKVQRPATEPRTCYGDGGSQVRCKQILGGTGTWAPMKLDVSEVACFSTEFEYLFRSGRKISRPRLPLRSRQRSQ